MTADFTRADCHRHTDYRSYITDQQYCPFLLQVEFTGKATAPMSKYHLVTHHKINH